MEKLKRFFQEKIILSAVMCVLLLAVLITATYSWYILNDSVAAHGLKLQAGAVSGIKVAVEPGGADIMDEQSGLEKNEAGVPIISFQLKKFENINGGEGGEIAPGAYGTLPFYITAQSRNVNSYAIKVQLEYQLSDQAQDKLSDEQKAKIQTWISDHIMVYKTKYTSNGIVKFKNPLEYYENVTDDVTAATGELAYMEEIPVEIYWSWNYELTDHPDYTSIARFPTHTDASETALQAAVRQYDEEDTLLGNCIEKVWLNVYIEGRKENP